MHLSGYHVRDAFVQIAEAGGEAALVEKADPGHQRIVKRRDESFEFLFLGVGDIVQPVAHERTQESTNSFGRRRVHLCNPADEEVLVELAGATSCTPIDVASQNVLEAQP